MTEFSAKIIVRLKNEVLDPQGDSVKTALNALGFENIGNVRQGKIFDVKIDAENEGQAKEKIEEMTRKLLVNELIENCQIEMEKK